MSYAPTTHLVGYENQDTTNGSSCPAALVANPFAHQFAHASQMGDFQLADGLLDPGTLFESLDPSQRDIHASVGVVMLNSLTQPLTLVESFSYSYSGMQDVDVQRLYPAYVHQNADFTNFTVTNHVIPAARPYPSPKKHLDPQGNPALMGGVGFYSFTANIMVAPSARVLGFATTADGSGPMVGVAFRVKNSNPTIWAKDRLAFSTVKADMARGTLPALVQDLFPDFVKNGGYPDASGDDDTDPVSKLCDVGSNITIWAAWASTPGYTLTVWVRDSSSTLS